MNARKIELKAPVFTFSGDTTEQVFSYKVQLTAMINAGRSAQGSTADDIIRMVDLRKSLNGVDAAWLLSEEDHAWIVGKLNAGTFQHHPDFDELVAQFILDVRNAPIVDVNALDQRD